MRLYARQKFRGEARNRDPQVIEHLLKLGQEEVDSMNYFHALREEKERGVRNADSRVTREEFDGRAPAASAMAAPPVEAAALVVGQSPASTQGDRRFGISRADADLGAATATLEQVGLLLQSLKLQLQAAGAAVQAAEAVIQSGRGKMNGVP
jgi:hypothetical protein